MELNKGITISALALALMACGGGSSGSSGGEVTPDDNGDGNGSTPGAGTDGNQSVVPQSITRDNYLDFAKPVWSMVNAEMLAIAPTVTVIDTTPGQSDCSEGGSKSTSLSNTKEFNTLIREGTEITVYHACDIGLGPTSGTSRKDLNYFPGEIATYSGYIVDDAVEVVRQTVERVISSSQGVYDQSENFYYVKFDDWQAINPGYVLNSLVGTEAHASIEMPKFNNESLELYASGFVGSDSELSIRNKACLKNRDYHYSECSLIHYSPAEDTSYVTLASGKYEPLFGAGESGNFEATYKTVKPIISDYLDNELVITSGELVLEYNTGPIIKVEVRGDISANDNNEAVLTISLDEDGDGTYDLNHSVYDGLIWIDYQS